MKRILVAATGPLILPSIEAVLKNEEVSCLGVITQPARPVGRHKTVTPTPAAVWAEQRHLPVLSYSTLRGHEDEIRAMQPEAMLIADIGLIIPKKILEFLPQQVINLHGSLLPAYRGPAPIEQAILDGQAETGISWMIVEPSVDTGPILAQHRLSIESDDDSQTLYQKMSELGAATAVATCLGYWNGTITPQPQNTEAATFTTKFTRESGQASWDSALHEERKTRAFRPWPGLWTIAQGQRLKIHTAHVINEPRTELPGTIIPYQDRWAIVCRQGLLEPLTVQREGKKISTATEMLASWPNLLGTRCT